MADVCLSCHFLNTYELDWQSLLYTQVAVSTAKLLMSGSTQATGVLDASHATDHIILMGWVLDNAIDSDKVKNAWAALVDVWPLLIARLRRDKDTGRWEYQIPLKPSLAGSFAALSISNSIHNHYTYSKPSDEIFCTPKQNPHHLFLPYAPKSVNDLLVSDIPICHLHVTNFDDGALVGLSVPHILCDASGVSTIIRALCTLINTGERPSPLNLADPFLQYDTKGCDVSAPPQWRVLTRFEGLVLYIRRIWESLFDQRVENYDIFIPQSDVLRMKAEAMEDIYREKGSNTDCYVSSSDVVLAFLLKCSHPPTISRAPLNVFYTANLRGVLRIREPFIHNAVAMVVTPPLPCSSISKIPLGVLSLRIRETLKSETTLSAAETWIRWRLVNASRPKTFFSPLTGHWNVVTNTRSMKLMDIDFSGAIADVNKVDNVYDRKDQTSRKVSCVYAWGDGIQPYQLRNWIGLWADDPRGGIWTSAFLPTSVWQNKKGFGQFIGS